MHEKIAFKNNHQEQLKHLPTTEKSGKGKRSLKSVRKKKKKRAKTTLNCSYLFIVPISMMPIFLSDKTSFFDYFTSKVLLDSPILVKAI